MDDLFQIGLWQARGKSGDVAANLAEVSRVTADAASRGLDLLVFPECFLTGYYTSGSVPDIAAEVTSDILGELAGLSARTGVALVVGSYEPDAEGVFNSAYAFTPTDGLAATCRKQALFGAWEHEVFRPGRTPTLLRHKGVSIGILICYDIEFPERVRELAGLGADLVVCPTALMAPYDTVPKHIVPARAFENHVFVAYANRIGQEGPYRFLGQSRIVGPSAQILVAAGEDEGLVVAGLDLGLRDLARADYDYLSDLAEQARNRKG